MKKQNPKNIFFITASIFLGVLTVIAIVLAMTISGAISEEDNHHSKSFNIQGSAEVKTKPDTASFSVTIEEKAKDSVKATEALNKKTQTIIDAIILLEIPEEDMATNSYSVYENFEWQPQKEGRGGKQVSVGWVSQQSLVFDVEDLEKAPKVLAELNKHNVRVGGPNYRVAHPEVAKEVARTKAIENAKKQAQKLAHDLGVGLGEMISYHEVNSGHETPYSMMRTEMDFSGTATKSGTAPTLPKGEDVVSITVELVFGFE